MAMYNVQHIHTSTHRFLSPPQGLASHDDVVFEDAVAPVCYKNASDCEYCEKTERHTSFPDEKLELLPMDTFPVEFPPFILFSFSVDSFLLASRSAAATSILPFL